MGKQPYVRVEANVGLKIEPQATKEEKQLFAWICWQMETEGKKVGEDKKNET